MKQKISNKQGFTLIELLVTITIIGILATGASTVYVSAQQKARDSIRQTDVMALKGSIEQSYGDLGIYPKSTELNSALVTAKYMTKLPEDPKYGQVDSETVFDYVYGAAQDSNLVSGQLYEVSANFENSGNSTSKEANTADAGDDAERWEIGNGTNGGSSDAGVYTNCEEDTPGGCGGTVGTNTYATSDTTSGAPTVIRASTGT